MGTCSLPPPPPHHPAYPRISPLTTTAHDRPQQSTPAPHCNPGEPYAWARRGTGAVGSSSEPARQARVGVGAPHTRDLLLPVRFPFQHQVTPRAPTPPAYDTITPPFCNCANRCYPSLNFQLASMRARRGRYSQPGRNQRPYNPPLVITTVLAVTSFLLLFFLVR